MLENSASDALSGLAPLLRVRPELQHICRFGAQWASNHPPERNSWAPFHIVTGGTCILHLTEPGRAIPLGTGDVVVLPHGSAHVVHGEATSPESRGPFGIQSRDILGMQLKSNTDAEPETQLVCGRLKFEQAGQNLVMAALPEAIVISAAAGQDTLHAQHLITLIKAELDSARPGAAAIAADLASALLVMAVRTYIESQTASESILALLSHPQAGRAVGAMLQDLSRAWTLDELAALANASRANLVRIFRKTAQVAPLAFLSEMRLELARRKISSSSRPLAGIAAEAGYQSESAFSRAFQLRYGMRPGEARACSGKQAP
jgi:AraC family transcriptional regulator, activator of mtrCDE